MNFKRVSSVHYDTLLWLIDENFASIAISRNHCSILVLNVNSEDMERTLSLLMFSS